MRPGEAEPLIQIGVEFQVREERIASLAGDVQVLGGQGGDQSAISLEPGRFATLKRTNQVPLLLNRWWRSPPRNRRASLVSCFMMR